MIRNSQPMVSVPVQTLQELRGWIIHWEADKRCNLTPTDESLNTARELIRDALDAPRSFQTAE
jgi:hypothetical protein